MFSGYREQFDGQAFLEEVLGEDLTRRALTDESNLGGAKREL
jgi:hypothetical protein